MPRFRPYVWLALAWRAFLDRLTSRWLWLASEETGGPVSLNIIVVGGGIGGLAAAYCLARAGHAVTILERAAAAGDDVGAGIQVSPNFSRLLIRWGLGEELAEKGCVPEGIAFLRYSTGERVGATRWGKQMEADYGAPYYHIHRADLLRMLTRLCARRAALRLDSRVASVDPITGSVVLSSGEMLTADLIVGADGIKSVVRSAVQGEKPPLQTGDAVYRAVIPTDGMLADPDLEELVRGREMVNWMGPEKHVIGYCIRAGREYNLVLVHPDCRTRKESYMCEGSVEQMRSDFEGWDPRLQKLLRLVEKTYILPLMYRPPIEGWVHANGKMVLLGDSAHATLPSRAQGAAMAVEDAAVLGVLLSSLHSRSEARLRLQAYRDLRYARTEATQRASLSNHRVFHLPDGEAQQRRDASMRAAMAGSESDHNANIWADQKKSAVQFGYDAERVAQEWLDAHAGPRLAATRSTAKVR